jgi:hypothetical protein
MVVNLASYRAFGDELRKIAGVSLDAGTRANLAGRDGLRPGVEYLVGGELPSNDPGQTNFKPKLAEASEVETKAYKKYKRYREPAAAAMKGAFPGAFIGNILGPAKMGKNPVRAGALLGAGAGIADWIASGKARKWREAGRKAKTAMVMGSDTFTPGRALSQSRQVGSFKDKVIHKGEILKPVKAGPKFSIPETPTE